SARVSSWCLPEMIYSQIHFPNWYHIQRLHLQHESLTFSYLLLPDIFRAYHKKESCFAGFYACGGAHERQFPFRRSAILAERFLFHRKLRSYEIKKYCRGIPAASKYKTPSLPTAVSVSV